MKRLGFLATALALVGLFAIPGVALAAGNSSGDTAVGATITTYYTLVAPPSIDLGTAISTVGDISKGSYSVSVSTNDATVSTCGITVADKQAGSKGANSGKLMSGTYAFAGNLQVGGGAIAGESVLGQTPVTLRAASTPYANASMTDFHVKQSIVASDLSHAGSYALTLTFTATFGP